MGFVNPQVDPSCLLWCGCNIFLLGDNELTRVKWALMLNYLSVMVSSEGWGIIWLPDYPTVNLYSHGPAGTIWSISVHHWDTVPNQRTILFLDRLHVSSLFKLLVCCLLWIERSSPVEDLICSLLAQTFIKNSLPWHRPVNWTGSVVAVSQCYLSLRMRLSLYIIHTLFMSSCNMWI